MCWPYLSTAIVAATGYLSPSGILSVLQALQLLVRNRYINGNTIIIPMSLYFIVALFYHHAEKDPVKPRKVISPITGRNKHRGKNPHRNCLASVSADIRVFADQEGHQCLYDSILQARGPKKAYDINKRSIVGFTNVCGTPVNPMII